MSFNPVEYLKEGKVDFVFSLLPYDYNSLIERIRNNPNKHIIIDGFLSHLKDSYPKFCLEIIYDIDDYFDTTLYLLNNKYIGYHFFTPMKLKSFLMNTLKGRDYVLEHLEELIIENKENYDEILNYIFLEIDANQDFVEKLYLHPNLHTRYLFMKALLLKNPNKIEELYGNILDYLTSYTHQEYEQMTFLPERMNFHDVSSLAMLFLNELHDKEMFIKLKEYILTYYEENDLAKLLFMEEQLDIFKEDAIRLFETSHSFRFQIYSNYSEYISKDMLKAFYEKIKYFKKGDHFDPLMVDVYWEGLGKKLEKYVDKYLSLSQDTSTEYIRTGSTSSCYRVGDYVIKLCRTKWSYEDIICPNLYLILDNLEEEFIRDKNNIIVSGIEVQKYLKRSAKEVPNSVIQFFYEELRRLGYYITDSLINGSCGDNCRLLDSYLDANVFDHSKLPDIFKEYPMVLVDRDRVYQLENKFPKQLHQSFY